MVLQRYAKKIKKDQTINTDLQFFTSIVIKA